MAPVDASGLAVAACAARASGSLPGPAPPRVTVEVSNTAGAQLNRPVVQSDLASIMSESQLDTANGAGLAPLPMANECFTRAIGALTRKGVTLPALLEGTARAEAGVARRGTKRPGRA